MRRNHRPNGVTRINLIQMSFYGFDNSYMLDMIKLYEGGRLNESLAAIIRSNTRAPDLVMGDFHAPYGATAIAAP